MDFTPSPHLAFSDAFEAHVDAALVAANTKERASYFDGNADANRPAIGAGRLGNECLRAIGYEYFRTPKDEGRQPGGALFRIFDRGHLAETKMAEYLRTAGFTLLTERPSGGQFRFDLCRYENGKGRIKGMADGVITALPEAFAAPRPAPWLWENKELGNKGWTKLHKDGVQRYSGDYYCQIQLGMAYLELETCLFTAKNADTQKIHAEMIPFDAAAAQVASDRGARVVSAMAATDLPRIAKEPTDFRCKWCDYAGSCWAEPTADVAPAVGWAAQWGGGNASGV